MDRDTLAFPHYTLYEATYPKEESAMSPWKIRNRYVGQNDDVVFALID